LRTNKLIGELPNISLDVIHNKSSFRQLWVNIYRHNAEREGNIRPVLFLSNAADTTFNVDFQFGLMNGKDQKIVYFDRMIGYPREHFGKMGNGPQTFLSHAQLFDDSKNYIVDGKLTVACKVN